MNRKRLIPLAAVLVIGGAIWWLTRPPRIVTLTGIVTTKEIIVSPLVAGRVDKLLVSEGDSVVQGQIVATIVSDELTADRDFYLHSAQGLAAQAQASAATLRFQEQQLAEQIHQADANVGAAQAQQAEARATLDNAQRTWQRTDTLVKAGQMSPQDADRDRTAFQVAQARLDAVNKQVASAQAAAALVRADANRVAAAKSGVESAQQQQKAATAEATKAGVRLGYTELRAPISGTVDVSAVRSGEVVTAGQPVMTLVNPDDLWIRADVEESYADRVRPGDSLTVRLPSGEERWGVVFFRGVDAAFATQRDVSRSKRDIKTFEIRLRLDNRNRRLAVGMTAYVLLSTDRVPVGQGTKPQ